MTFYDISRKLLWANFSRYKLYFLCNLSACILFYCFAAIFTNKSFMNDANVNSMISNNIYFPSLLAALFLLLFLPISCQAFLASRKQEYGILLSLGMSRKEAFWNMMLENLAISIVALAVALAMGTVLSFLFFAFVTYVIEIEGVHWQFGLEPYMTTAILYAIVMAVTLVFSAIRLLKEKITVLLKAPYHAGKKGVISRILCRVNPKYMKEHILQWSFVIRHSREWCLRYMLATAITTCSIVMVSLCITLNYGFIRDAISYSPYDMVYSNIFGKNHVPKQTVTEILNKRGIIVEQIIQIPYARDHVFNYLSATDLNQYFGCDYNVKEGEFLNLFQYDLQDGYTHDLNPVSLVTFGEGKLYSIGSDTKILFNKNPAFADRTLIVSETDFAKIQKNQDYWVGTANLFSFDNWKDSYDAINEVNQYLQESNQADEIEQHHYAATSKIGSFQDAEKSGRFLLFLMVFVISLMIAADWMLIHFRIRKPMQTCLL